MKFRPDSERKRRFYTKKPVAADQFGNPGDRRHDIQNKRNSQDPSWRRDDKSVLSCRADKLSFRPAGEIFGVASEKQASRFIGKTRFSPGMPEPAEQ